MTLPELVKRGWRFEPLWDAALNIWHVITTKQMWGITSGGHWSRDWDAAHEKARAWAAGEERIVNGDERHDTEPAPAMEARAAE